jgi:hypothetical protein
MPARRGPGDGPGSAGPCSAAACAPSFSSNRSNLKRCLTGAFIRTPRQKWRAFHLSTIYTSTLTGLPILRHGLHARFRPFYDTRFRAESQWHKVQELIRICTDPLQGADTEVQGPTASLPGTSFQAAWYANSPGNRARLVRRPAPTVTVEKSRGALCRVAAGVRRTGRVRWAQEKHPLQGVGPEMRFPGEAVTVSSRRRGGS